MSTKLKDGGSRVVYSTGAKKEPPTLEKGAYHLIPTVPLRLLAQHYAKGAAKYTSTDPETGETCEGSRNWELGLSLSTCIDSAFRHFTQLMEGMEDEPHDVACCWWLFAFIHIKEMIRRGRLPAELNDLPSYAPANPEETEVYGMICEKWRSK